MKEFKAAAKAASDDEDAKVLEFKLGDEEYVVDKPGTAQIVLVLASQEEGGSAMISAVFRFLRGILHDDGYKRLRNQVADGIVPLGLLIGGDDDNEDGIVDWIIEKSSDDRPTKQPADYLPSQGNGGQRSTGRSPGKGSKPSRSLPAAS